MLLTHRPATLADEPILAALMRQAIDRLQSPFLTPDQVRASHAFMGLDSRLIANGTYFVVEEGDIIAGCGGWSRRATAYGGNHSAGRDDRLLDPATEAAKVRAMYIHPDRARKGVGTLVLSLCQGRRGRRALPRWNCPQRWRACHSIAASALSMCVRSKIAACR